MSNAKTKSKPTRMLLEVTSGAKILMLKRGRLFALGSNIPVRSLPSTDGKQNWLGAEIDCAARAPWDVAHDMASRVKKESGQSVFIEPDVGAQHTRFGLLAQANRPPRSSMHQSLPGRQRSQASRSPFEKLAGRRTKGAGLGNPFSAVGAAMPFVQPGLPGIPDPVADIFPEALLGGFPMDNDDLALGFGSQKLPDANQMGLDALPAWQSIEPTKQKMFETEARQLWMQARHEGLLFQQQLF